MENEQQEMELNTETTIGDNSEIKQKAAEKIQSLMIEATDTLSTATNTKVLIMFITNDNQQCGSFASSNLNVFEERGLVAQASRQ